MKTIKAIFVILCLAMFFMQGCSNKRSVTFNSVPRYAHAFKTGTYKHYGEMPFTLWYIPSKQAKQKGYMYIDGFIAKWASGAKKVYHRIKVDLVKGPLTFTFFRPDNAPNPEVDFEYETAKDRNEIMREGVDEQRQSNTQNGILGLGLLCVLQGSCR